MCYQPRPAGRQRHACQQYLPCSCWSVCHRRLGRRQSVWPVRTLLYITCLLQLYSCRMSLLGPDLSSTAGRLPLGHMPC